MLKRKFWKKIGHRHPSSYSLTWRASFAATLFRWQFDRFCSMSIKLWFIKTICSLVPKTFSVQRNSNNTQNPMRRTASRYLLAWTNYFFRIYWNTPVHDTIIVIHVLLLLLLLLLLILLLLCTEISTNEKHRFRWCILHEHYFWFGATMAYFTILPTHKYYYEIVLYEYILLWGSITVDLCQQYLFFKSMI